MSEITREPTDAEFAALMDNVSPDRQREPGTENVTAPEPQAAPEPVEVPEVPAEEALPEKYQGKTPAELAQMHSQLEQRLGQQGQELGELRAIREEFAQLRESMATPEPAPWEAQQGYDNFEERVLTDPKGTLDWIAQNQPQLLERGLATWAQLDPFAAARYDTAHQLAEVRRLHAAELDAVRAPVVQSQNDAMLQQAYQNVANTNTLLASVAEDIPALLEENPEFKVLLGNGDVPTRERALNNLVAIAAQRRAESTGTPAETAASAAHQAKTLAAVATSGSAAEHGGQPGSTAASRMLASEGTSIADELARNRAAHGR
jgi:hypothetical protein